MDRKPDDVTVLQQDTTILLVDCIYEDSLGRKCGHLQCVTAALMREVRELRKELQERRE